MNFFQTPEYLAVFARHFCRQEDIVVKIWEKTKNKLVLLGMKPVLGSQEVTDFAQTDITQLQSGYNQVQLDNVREDSATWKNFGPGQLQEVSPYLFLPKNWEAYLQNLDRKYRKELKRKFSRLGEIRHEFVKEDNLAEFFRLHRLSDPAKNKFMTEPMAEFFRDVFQAKIPGWESRLDFLKIEGKYAAGILSFVSCNEWWLYNSGYDPSYSFYSVGLLLKAQSIHWAIEQGKKKYDFLRGNERYKYDLGAKNLRLYRIEIRG